MRGDIILFPDLQLKALHGELDMREIDCWLMLLRGPVFSSTLEAIRNPFDLEMAPGRNYERGGIHIGKPEIFSRGRDVHLSWDIDHTWFADQKRDPKLRAQVARWGLFYTHIDDTMKRVGYLDIGEEHNFNSGDLSIRLGAEPPVPAYGLLERIWRWMNGLAE